MLLEELLLAVLWISVWSLRVRVWLESAVGADVCGDEV